MVEVGDGHDRRARHHHFADLGLAHRHHPVEGRRQRGVGEDDVREPHRLVGAMDGRLGRLHVALGGGDQRTVPFEHGAALLERGFGLVEHRGGDEALLTQIGVAPQIEPMLGLHRLVGQHGLARGHQRLAGSIELAGLKRTVRLRNHDLLPVIGIIQPCHDGTLLHPLAFVEGQFDDARLDRLEAQDALVRLDVARQGQFMMSARRQSRPRARPDGVADARADQDQQGDEGHNGSSGGKHALSAVQRLS